jgi:two-component system, sporulation sensor kinase C
VAAVLAEKRAEESGRVVESRFRSIASLAPVGFFIADPAGLLTYVNPRWCELADTPTEAALGRSWTFPLHPEDLPGLLEVRARLVAAQGTWGLECRTRPRPDGEVHWLYGTATALKDDQGRTTGFLGMAADITERKRFETRLRDMEKVTARGRMAAYIAHEINNPLAGIKNAFQLLEPAIPPDHPHYRYKDLIKREIDRISGIIRTLYHVYRPDPMEARETSPLEILQDIASLLAPLCRSHDVRVDLRTPGPVDIARLPGGLLRQVVFNLVQNAVEASPKGGLVVLEASTRGGRLRFSVTDEGSGIPPELGEQVFESGYTSKHGPGMNGLGLGLATCKSLVESLQGQLFHGPGPSGQGTSFHVDLPLA